MLTAARMALHGATRFAIVRRPTLAAIRTLTELSARVVASLDAVAAVYVRGSYARGGFRPFISDIDLAIAVRRPAGGAYRVSRALHRRLALARLLNPFVRDVWQTIVTEAQWPLVARYGYLLGTDEWRRIAGADPWSRSEREDERLLLAAWWNRQHLWTTLAVRQALLGQTSLRALGASLKKAKGYADRIARRLPTGPAALPDEDGQGRAPVAAALCRLDRSAEELIRHLDLSHRDPAASGDEAGRAEPTRSERPALELIEDMLARQRAEASVVATEGQLVLIAGSAWTAEEYAASLAAMTRVRRLAGRPLAVYSEQAFALAPLRRPIRVLRLRPGSAVGATIAAGPHLLTEQLLYEALYLGTHLWVAPGRPDPAARLEAHLIHALEYCLHFLTGRLGREPRTLAELLADVRALDPELAARLDAGPGPRSDGHGRVRSAEELFETGSIVAERLSDLLVGLDPRALPAPVAAAS